jgi:protoporphyrinogen oxidase
VDRVISDSERIHYFKKEEVMDTLVTRVKYAYPFYDLNYREKLDKVVNFFEDGSTYLLGRTGIFRYNNSDNSIEMGFELAEKLLAGEKDASVYQYKVKKVSY